MAHIKPEQTLMNPFIGMQPQEMEDLARHVEDAKFLSRPTRICIMQFLVDIEKKPIKLSKLGEHMKASGYPEEYIKESPYAVTTTAEDIVKASAEVPEAEVTEQTLKDIIDERRKKQLFVAEPVACGDVEDDGFQVPPPPTAEEPVSGIAPEKAPESTPTGGKHPDRRYAKLHDLMALADESPNKGPHMLPRELLSKAFLLDFVFYSTEPGIWHWSTEKFAIAPGVLSKTVRGDRWQRERKLYTRAALQCCVNAREIMLAEDYTARIAKAKMPTLKQLCSILGLGNGEINRMKKEDRNKLANICLKGMKTLKAKKTIQAQAKGPFKQQHLRAVADRPK
jgi:hypothetical protein